MLQGADSSDSALRCVFASPDHGNFLFLVRSKRLASRSVLWLNWATIWLLITTDTSTEVCIPYVTLALLSIWCYPPHNIDCRLLNCDTVRYSGWLLLFRRNVPPPSSNPIYYFETRHDCFLPFTVTPPPPTMIHSVGREVYAPGGTRRHKSFESVVTPYRLSVTSCLISLQLPTTPRGRLRYLKPQVAPYPEGNKTMYLYTKYILQTVSSYWNNEQRSTWKPVMYLQM